MGEAVLDQTLVLTVLRRLNGRFGYMAALLKCFSLPLALDMVKRVLRYLGIMVFSSFTLLRPPWWLTVMPIGSVALILGAPHPAMVFFMVINLCLGTRFPVLVLRLNTELLLMLLLKLVGFGCYLRSFIVLSSDLFMCIATTLVLQHTKHVEIDLHFVRDKVTTGAIRVLHVPTTPSVLNCKTFWLF